MDYKTKQYEVQTLYARQYTPIPFIQQSPSLWSGKHLAYFSNVKISIFKPRFFREIGASKIKAKLVFLCFLL